jgi:hypothetical protein
MNRRLKDFIDENRRAFDDETPSPDAWHRVEKNIGISKPARKFSIKPIYKWSVAAAVVAILLAGAYFVAIDNSKPPVQPPDPASVPAVKNGNGTDLSAIAPEYAAQVKKIHEAIEEQQQQLKVMTESRPELYSQFAQDLAALDSSYRVLKMQAVQTPSREVIIKAMLQNLQLQAELLSKQLLILHDLNDNKKNNNEKNSNPSI